jgi:hypothetical protein
MASCNVVIVERERRMERHKSPYPSRGETPRARNQMTSSPGGHIPTGGGGWNRGIGDGGKDGGGEGDSGRRGGGGMSQNF